MRFERRYTTRPAIARNISLVRFVGSRSILAAQTVARAVAIALMMSDAAARTGCRDGFSC